MGLFLVAGNSKNRRVAFKESLCDGLDDSNYAGHQQEM